MLDHDLAEVARLRHGVLTSDDLRRLGVSDRQLKRRLDSGALERLHGSVVAIAGSPRTWERAAVAALAAVPDGVLSHDSAGRVHRYPQMKDIVVVSAPTIAHHALHGVRVRRTDPIPHDHRTVVDGFLVTTRARTIVDLAADLRDGRLRWLIEEELDAGRVSWDEVVDMFRQRARRGRPGIARMRRTLERIEGRPPTESKLERMYLELLDRAGVRPPTMQVTAPWAEVEPGRVDGMYAGSKAIIELDGRRFHAREAAFERDRRRDQLATLKGYATTRFTYRQIHADPDFVVEVTRYLANRVVDRPHG